MPQPVEERESLFQRIVVVAHELSVILRAAALHGMDVRVDTVERVDPMNTSGLGYTEIKVERMPEPEDDDANKE